MMTDDELKDLVAGLAKSHTKLDEKLDRLADSQVKTDAQLAKTDAQLAKTDAQLAKTDAQLAKTDAQLAKTDAQLSKTNERLEEMMGLYGNMGKNIGHAVEEFFYTKLQLTSTLNGVRYDFIDKNITRSGSGREREYDILMINGREVAIIEVKHRAHPKDVDKLISKLAPDFRVLFPQYQGYQMLLVLATFSIEDEVKSYALENGVSVLQRKGDIIETTAA
jgi:hypothetical protein